MLPGRHFLRPENRPKRKNENHRKFFQKLLDTGRFVWYIKQALRRRGRVVQSVRTLACHARGRGFKSLLGRHHAPFIGGMTYAVIAQSVERILGKDEVPSSNLGNSSKKACNRCDYRLFYIFRTSSMQQSIKLARTVFWVFQPRGSHAVPLTSSPTYRSCTSGIL